MDNKKAWKIGKIFLVILIVILGIGFLAHFGQSNEDFEQQAKDKSGEKFYKAYDETVDLINNKDWYDAAIRASRYKGNPEFKGMYYYASAKDAEAKGYAASIEGYLEDIPDDYAGAFADEILEYKRDYLETKKKKDNAMKQAIKEDEEERAKHIYIGDPESKIRDVMGEPDDINRTVNSGKVRKQYVFCRSHKNIYIYTENGIVTAFQD